MKIAYFCEPQHGGTYTFFRRMRPALAERGIEFVCIPPYRAECFAGTDFEHEDGVDYVSFPQNDLPAATRVLIAHLERAGYDAVVVLPGSDTLCVNLVRFLPRSIRTAARVPMITRGAYAPTRAIASHVDLVFAVSHRVRDDLAGRYHVPAERIRVIYNGVDVQEPRAVRSFRHQGEPFRLIYSGRLWDIDKGVSLLPDILERARQAGVNAQLTIVGSGPDEDRLRERFARKGLAGHVHMMGKVPHEQVEALLAGSDCFVLPSRFEGCPNALLEAMAAGCPSVAARIRGSVDRIIEHQQSGWLAEVADPKSFAEAIATLAGDPERCARMSEAARARVIDRFTTEHTADDYAKALLSLMGQPDHRSPALSMDHYHLPSAMQPTWRTRIPAPIKNFIRKWLERFGISS